MRFTEREKELIIYCVQQARPRPISNDERLEHFKLLSKLREWDD